MAHRLKTLFTLLALTAGLLIATAQPALADDGGYPYASYSGPGTDAPGSYWTDTQGNGYSPYRYVFRNCTDYVAWKLDTTNDWRATNSKGAAISIGNGADWGVWAKTNKYTVDMQPAIGSVAWWDSTRYSGWGHVAYVTGLHMDAAGATTKVDLAEYNWPTSDGKSFDGAFHTRTVKTGDASGYIHFKDTAGSTKPPPATAASILAIKRTTGPDGARQAYAATKDAVTEAYWFPGGDGIHKKIVFQPPDGPITGIDKTTLPNGDQVLYTAVPSGVYETWWRAGTLPSTSKVITGRTNVRQVIVDNHYEGSQFVHRVYALAEDGPFEVYWKDGGDGYHLHLLSAIAGPVTMAKSTGPDSSDQLYVATPTWVYEVWWRPGAGGVGAVVNIPQADIRDLAKQSLPDGTQILYTASSTTVWRSTWGGGRNGITHDALVAGQTGIRRIKKTVTSGADQLYLATGDHVQEYYWNAPGSGGGTLISIPQNNITALDKTTDGSAQQLYTAAGAWVWETWWGGGVSPSSTPLFKVER